MIPTRNRRKILIVDDAADAKESLSLLLRLKDYDTSTAANGAEALTMIRGEKPDLVILDLFMPVQNGWITLDKKNADPEIAKIPVIVLSGWTQKAEPIVGATVLAKTVGADILLREIHRLSEKRLDP